MQQFVDSFYDGAAQFPDRVFAIDPDGREWTYAEMARVADRVATGILAAGVEPGSRIAILSPNHVYGLAVNYGIVRAGCVWVPLNYRMGANAVRETLSDIPVAGVFSHTSLEADLVDPAGADTGVLGVVLLDGTGTSSPSLEDWLPDEVASSFPERGPEDAAAILLTSGTTGKPKGIVVPHRAFVAMLRDFDLLFDYPEPPRHLVVAPITHAAGIYAAALNRHGGTHVLMDQADPGAILRAIEQHRITTVFLPPTLIYLMLSHPEIGDHDYSSLRSLLYGAAPMSADKVREAWEAFGPVMFQGYGQSEALMIASVLTTADHAEALADPSLVHRLASAGRVGPSSTVAIMDDDGTLLPTGERGEIVVRGEIVMTGYLDQPEATAEAQAFGWHHTGDVGYLDEDGYLFVVDRKKDMIITGGLNVFPGEIERVLLGHPDVRNAAVVGIPDDKWGEAVHAAVELKDGATATEADLVAYCRPLLGGVKTPKTISFLASLPRNATGKVLKREIREPYWKGHDRDI
ncbi:class I adenylate-forming enzyme family protein [Pimelobacter simplex]|uniref:class I adenylate-forming enzyme family protein n=1 Tax=Nocardioides simplex TaxID=2045 RepID=UPI003AAFAFCF